MSQPTDRLRADNAIYRQWMLLRLVAPLRHGLTLDELAARLKVTPRTIRRDVFTLQRAGFAIGWVRAWRGSVIRMNQPSLTLVEALGWLRPSEYIDPVTEEIDIRPRGQGRRSAEL